MAAAVPGSAGAAQASGTGGASGQALLFPGQGAQFVGMLGPWCDGHAGATDLFARASHILSYDLAAVCRSGPADRLHSTAVAQPAILVTSLAALRLLEDREPATVASCPITAGLSLGEYTALVFAGAIEFEDAVRLVDLRGRAMQACADAGGPGDAGGGMLAVLGLAREQVDALSGECRGDDVLEVANVLCPGNVVASGTVAACRRLEAAAVAAGAMKCVRLEVAGAFHTRLMQAAADALVPALAATTIRPPRIPVVSNVDARPHDDPAEIRSLLARQVCGVVEWQASMEHLLGAGVRSVVEVGPGRVLRGLLKRIDRGVTCTGVPE